MVCACACNSTAWKAAAGGWQVRDQCGFYNEVVTQNKKKQKNARSGWGPVRRYTQASEMGETRRPPTYMQGVDGACQEIHAGEMMGETTRSPTKPTLCCYSDMYKLFPHW